MTQLLSKNQGFAWFRPLSIKKERSMNTSTHYVISHRDEPDPFARKARSEVLPRRVYRWGVDGPWLLAWGSDREIAADFDKPAQQKSMFKHWFRRDSLVLDEA
jgi:hypothetical protein